MEPAATRILNAVMTALARYEQAGVGIDDYLDRELKHPEYRRTVGNLLFTFFRRRVRLERELRRLAPKAPKPRLRRLLLAALTQIFYADGIAPESAVNVAVSLAKEQGGDREAGFVNAVLRRARQTPPEAAAFGPDDLPPAILRRWRQRFNPAELQELAALFGAPAPNAFRCRRGAELGPAEAAAFAAVPLPPPVEGLPWSFYAIPALAPLLASEDWAGGRFYIQDPAAAAGLTLPDFSSVHTALDLCAAPGGKSLLLAELLPAAGRLLAADRSAGRQQRTAENFRRWQLPPDRFQILTAAPWELPPEAKDFDLVLADVPCSNTGVFRRRPDALWRFDAAALKDVAELQARILAAAAPRVAPGGAILYSSCSIEPEENEGQCDAFLRAFPDFTREAGLLLLPAPAHDGSFHCLLRRRGSG